MGYNFTYQMKEIAMYTERLVTLILFTCFIFFISLEANSQELPQGDAALAGEARPRAKVIFLDDSTQEVDNLKFIYI